LADVQVALYGDGSMSKREFETAPGLTDRLGSATWGSWSNRSVPTETMKAELAAAQEGVKTLTKSLNEAWAEAQSLDGRLGQAGGMRVILPDVLK
jgi:hypothetical protein